jgi:hypothetical protein
MDQVAMDQVAMDREARNIAALIPGCHPWLS